MDTADNKLTIVELRAKAERYRHYAASIIDQSVADRLILVAVEMERRASRLEHED